MVLTRGAASKGSPPEKKAPAKKSVGKKKAPAKRAAPAKKTVDSSKSTEKKGLASFAPSDAVPIPPLSTVLSQEIVPFIPPEVATGQEEFLNDDSRQSSLEEEDTSVPIPTVHTLDPPSEDVFPDVPT